MDTTTLHPTRIHCVTLSGYVHDMPRKLDNALSEYMTWSHDSSYSWGETPSLSRAIQQAGSNLSELCLNVKTGLENKLKPKFEKTSVEVTLNDNTTTSSILTLSIMIDLYDGGYKDESMKILEIEQGKFRRLISVHNGATQ